MESRIFLAYAREDELRVRQLYADLKGRGLAPWLDKIDLLPGQVWTVEIPRAIRQAEVFLACLSSRSVEKRGYIQNEFRLALSAFGERPPGSIFLIPVRLDDCQVPDLEIPDRGLSFRDLNWVDLWEEDGFDRLLRAIEHALGALASPRNTREEAPTTTHSSERVGEPEAAAAPLAKKAVAERAQEREPAAQRVSLRHPAIVAAIIGAIVSMAGAMYAYYQYQSEKTEKRIDRTRSYLERLESEPMHESRQWYDLFLIQNRDLIRAIEEANYGSNADEEKAQTLMQQYMSKFDIYTNPLNVQHVMKLFYFYADLANCVNINSCDARTACDLFAEDVGQLYVLHSDFVARWREVGFESKLENIKHMLIDICEYYR